MKKYKIVIDTNVIISALRSNKGASYKLLLNIDSERIIVNISVPLVIEYEAVAKRATQKIKEFIIDDILDYICAISVEKKIHYLWRPYLKDAKDDMILELAVASESDYISTFNVKDFKGSEEFGIEVITPQNFLKKIGLLS